MDECRDEGMESGRRKISIGLQTFRSFKNPVYRVYYGGLLGQMVSMNMQRMARLLLIYRLTGSAAILGAMSLAHALPMLFLSLFGGVIADRVQKKYVLLIGQTSSALVTMGVALALTLGYLSADNAGSWWILVVASVLNGIILGLMMPSRHAIVPEIVSGDELMNAIALGAMGTNALRLFAPALTGFLIDAFDFAAVYYTTSGLYLVSVVFVSFLPQTSTTSRRGSEALASIKEGFKYIWHETTILLLLAFALLTVILALPLVQLLPIFTEDILKVGATGMGVLMSVSGGGAIAGSLVLASLPNKKRGFMMLAAGLILGLSLVGFSFSSSWNFSLVLIIFFGLAQTGGMALANTLIQYYVDDEYRGRVMSILLLQWGLMSFSTFIAGLVAEGLGAQWAIGSFGMVLIFLSAMALVFIPRIRKMD
ncbi:MFS transporter [Chloroflexota bacterium]